MTISKVRDFNYTHRGTILAFTLGNGSFVDTPRQRGYVVHGGNSYRFFLSIEKAREYKKTEESKQALYKGSGIHGNSLPQFN